MIPGTQVAPAYGFGASPSNQSLNSAPNVPPVNSVVQDMLSRIGTANNRLSRIAQLVRSMPQVATDSPKPSPGDLTQALQMCHSALTYTESVIAELESIIGV